MNEATKKKFQEATSGLNLSNDQKKALVTHYSDDLQIIEHMDQHTFTFLVRQLVREWGWVSGGQT